MNVVFTPWFSLKRLDRQLMIMSYDGFHWFGFRTQDEVLAAAAQFARSLGKISSIEFRILALTNPSDPNMGTVMPVLSHTCQFVSARKLLVTRNKEVLVLDAHTRSLLALTDVADSLLSMD